MEFAIDQGSVVQSWINPGLKFSPLFWFISGFCHLTRLNELLKGFVNRNFERGFYTFIRSNQEKLCTQVNIMFLMLL